MDADFFIQWCKRAVASYCNADMEFASRHRPATEEDVCLVWSSKALQNNKACLCTTFPDLMYFELTWNGDKGELYLDAYRKVENRVLKLSDLDTMD